MATASRRRCASATCSRVSECRPFGQRREGASATAAGPVERDAQRRDRASPASRSGRRAATSSMAARSSRWRRSAVPRARRRGRPSAWSSSTAARMRPLPAGPTVGGGAGHDPLDVGVAEPAARSEPAVVLELVGAAAQVGDAEDDELGLAPGQGPAGHEPAGEAQPAAEQPPVAAEDEEQVGRGRARHPTRDAERRPSSPVRRRGGRRARPGAQVDVRHRPDLGCGVVSSTLLLAGDGERRRRPGRARRGRRPAGRPCAPAAPAPTHAGATIRRDRRAMPRSRASMPTDRGVTLRDAAARRGSVGRPRCRSPGVVMSVSSSAK